MRKRRVLSTRQVESCKEMSIHAIALKYNVSINQVLAVIKRINLRKAVTYEMPKL